MSEGKSGTDWTKLLTAVGGIITAFAALLTAVGGLAGGCSEPSAQLATATPIAAPSTAVPTTARLGFADRIQDDFSDPQSGWETGADADGEWGYKDGVYRIAVDTPDLAIWANSRQGEDWTDMVVEVDAYRAAGPTDNQYGVIVRYRDRGNFYLFSVASDGLYAVQMLRNDQWIDLRPWTASQAVHQESGVNLLHVECQGSVMRFFVNDEFLTEVTDATFPSGSVGLLAGSFAEGGVVVHFDNLLVQAAN
jgi:hypothetical protein